MRTTWKFSLPSNPGTMDVAYDLWLHTKNTADRQDRPTDEIMVWLDRQGGAGPLGTKYGSVSLDGAMWDNVSGIEAGTEVFKGTDRLDTTAYSVDIG
ncbi:hypothetical protein [Streptomyces sp. IMTB 2501]|uniref:GH12 family glycosyl hydrolase domain-containing protein n=1 Tax=Streptomyces sp. IMTB 2501 TaxID=1776340 RepID=UPI002116F529|nr:hypothetical protein [Streptomyces sp. IMTB 2501]